MVAEILRITDEEDLPNTRERKIDAPKWKVLDSFTFSDQFSINYDGLSAKVGNSGPLGKTG